MRPDELTFTLQSKSTGGTAVTIEGAGLHAIVAVPLTDSVPIVKIKAEAFAILKRQIDQVHAGLQAAAS